MNWIGVDLDGTLAHYSTFKGTEVIGEPIMLMVERVLEWLEGGQEVRIFTARADTPEALPLIEAWCLQHLGRILPITNVKDFEMIELWDDRAIRIIKNTGKPCCEIG